MKRARCPTGRGALMAFPALDTTAVMMGAIDTTLPIAAAFARPGDRAPANGPLQLFASTATEFIDS